MSSRNWNVRWLWLALAFSLMVSSASFLNGYWNEHGKKVDAQDTAKDERKQKDAVVDKASTLAQQVTTACAESRGKALRDLKEAGLCKQAEETATTIKKTADPATTPVVTGPTQAQVNAAVRLFLRGIDLTGPKGPKGERGPAPTMDQLLQALVSYCATRDECRGESIIGPKGDTGDKGEDAPIITTATCDADDHIVLGFSDGSSVTVTDSDCRVEVIPEEEP